ncbi:MAG: YggT family protein [Kangiellaceae bacterium]|nr:YggT family protein [Kangiellaceae bacterium]
MSALFTLLEHIINLFAMIFLVRMLLQLASADFYNPIAQFVHKVTGPILEPLRNLVPDIGKFSLASLLVVIIIIVAKFIIFGLIIGQMFPTNYMVFGSLVGLAFSNGMSIAGLLMIAINLLLILFVALMISSFMANGQYHPAITFFYQVTRPLLSPLQKIIPPIAGIDFSPMILLFGLFFLQNWLLNLGGKLLS